MGVSAIFGNRIKRRGWGVLEGAAEVWMKTAALR